MKIKYYKLLLLALPILFISCSDDDDENNVVVAPNTYEFTRDGASTVSFSGQTARLNMADEIYAALNTNCLLYTSPSPRDRSISRMPSSA